MQGQRHGHSQPPLCAIARLDGAALQNHRLAGDGEPEPVALAHAG